MFEKGQIVNIGWIAQ